MGSFFGLIVQATLLSITHMCVWHGWADCEREFTESTVARESVCLLGTASTKKIVNLGMAGIGVLPVKPRRFH